MNKTISKSFLHGFVLKSTLIFACGAVLTAAVFHLSLREPGASYADSYKFLAELDSVLVSRSLVLFFFTLLLSIAGIIILAIVYSHRVAGALHKLGMHSKRIASGDLAASVRLRSTDVIHDLADDFNGISGRYRQLLVQLEMKTRELGAVMDDQEKQGKGKGAAGGLPDKISESIDEIRTLLNQIKL
jgi:methyl-accepting chemotaxis protein